MTRGAPAISKTRHLTNAQTRVLPDRRTERTPAPAPVTTLLHGTANLKPAVHGDSEHVRGPTDHVGAILIGKDAARFEFVTKHPGATPRELPLLGPDGRPGLSGGPSPEAEEWAVTFLGATQPGRYSAIVRIVTQAANANTRSTGQPGEPVEAMYYTDVPVSVRVGP